MPIRFSRRSQRILRKPRVFKVGLAQRKSMTAEAQRKVRGERRVNQPLRDYAPADSL